MSIIIALSGDGGGACHNVAGGFLLLSLDRLASGSGSGSGGGGGGIHCGGRGMGTPEEYDMGVMRRMRIIRLRRQYIGESRAHCSKRGLP